LDWRSPQNSNLWQGINGVNNPCPNGYRLPTTTELDQERLSWASNTSAGAFASPLKLSLGGNRAYNTGAIQATGVLGFYWSSNVTLTGSSFLIIGTSAQTAIQNNNPRSYGASVRCIKN
jgi:hypothetical protein